MKTTRKRRILIAAMVIVVLLICSFIGLYVLAASIYDSNFNFRCTSSTDISFDISQFPAMTRQRHTFTSNSGQRLVGYLYQQPETAKKAVVVFAHGFGAGGQIGYMDIFDYLTSQGYYVFAYDVIYACAVYV